MVGLGVGSSAGLVGLVSLNVEVGFGVGARVGDGVAAGAGVKAGIGVGVAPGFVGVGVGSGARVCVDPGVGATAGLVAETERDDVVVLRLGVSDGSGGGEADCTRVRGESTVGTGRVTDVDSSAVSGPPLHARRGAIKTHTSVIKAFAKLGLKEVESTCFTSFRRHLTPSDICSLNPIPPMEGVGCRPEAARRCSGESEIKVLQQRTDTGKGVPNSGTCGRKIAEHRRLNTVPPAIIHLLAVPRLCAVQRSWIH